MPLRSALRLVLVMLPMVAAPAFGEETLRWKFAEGDRHRYELKQATVNTALVQEREVKTSIIQTLQISWVVDSVGEDGSARISQTIDRIGVSYESQFANFAYDSGEEGEVEGPAAALKPVIDAMVGTEVILLMSERGELTDVEVPEALLEKLREAGPAVEALQNLASAEGMKGLIGQSTLILPEDPVDEGTSWQRDVDLPTPQGQMSLTNSFTVEGLEDSGGDQVARITLAMTFDEFLADPDAPFQMQVEEQEGGGTYTFNNGAGRLQSSEVTQHLSAVISVMDQQISFDADSTATLTRAED